jgi:hypothetical protein
MEIPSITQMLSAWPLVLAGIRQNRRRLSYCRYAAFNHRAVSEITHYNVAPSQAELMRHRARELLAGHRTATLNARRGGIWPRSASSRRRRAARYDLKRLAVDCFDEYS